MRHRFGWWLILSLLTTAFSPVAATGDEPADAEQKYQEVLNRRGDEILAVLNLADPAAAVRVKDQVMKHYRGLREIHDTRDQRIARLKAEPKPRDPQGSREPIDVEKTVAEAAARDLSERTLVALAADLTLDQLEAVQDKMTYNKRIVTLKGYRDMLPNLTEPQVRVIALLLTQARDRAISAGSAEEKTAIFDRFKGRINNYLSAQGYDLKQASKDWAERRKAQAPAQP